MQNAGKNDGQGDNCNKNAGVFDEKPAAHAGGRSLLFVPGPIQHVDNHGFLSGLTLLTLAIGADRDRIKSVQKTLILQLFPAPIFCIASHIT